MKLKAYYIFGLIVLAFVGIAVGRYLIYKDVLPEHALLYDQSKSKIDGCSCLKNYARQLVKDATRRDEKVTLYSLGTEADGYQPKFIDTFTIPKDDSPLGDRSKEEGVVENFLNTIETKCKGIPRSNRTPLVQGVKTILEQLHSKCSPTSLCSLYIQSDLEDDVSPDFLEAFKLEKNGKQASNLERFDNAGISVTFAGTAEIVVTAGNTKKSGKDRALRKLNDGPVWKSLWSRSFTRPELLTFQPICGRSTESVEMTTKK
jgi:hypothetical protein